MEMQGAITNWIGAILTIMALTYLLPLKRHYLYRIAERIFVAATAGNAVVIALGAVWQPALSLQKGDLFQLVPIAAGLLLFARYGKGYSWLARYPTALLMGVGTGVAIRSTADAQIVGQLSATILSVVGTNLLRNFNNLCIILMTPLAMLYFFFVRPEKGRVGSILGKVSELGRIVILVSLGSLYGNFVMTRVAGLIGVMQFLLFDWLGFSG